MKSDELKKLISQIKKYDLTKVFGSVKEFDEWLSKLNVKQIRNFNSLTVNPISIMFPVRLLIDRNLLNCDDYKKRIDAMLTLKNGDGCWHLFDRLCSPNFLKSNNYYEDIKMISKANTSTFRYTLWVIDNDSFIQSKYHKEDLKRIIEAKDPSEEKDDALVAEASAMVARDQNSIDSPYHQQDMELIAKSGSKCLQGTGYPSDRGLNNLAVAKVSLHDAYHLENMQILAKNPIASKYLYKMMNSSSTIKGPNYRDEIKALESAKSQVNALAIYLYIVNPQDIHFSNLYKLLSDEVLLELDDYGLDRFDIEKLILNRDSVKGALNPKYLEYLTLLNQIDSKFVMYIESVISNKCFINSPYKEEALKLLLSITDIKILQDLCLLMMDEISLSGPYCIKDAKLIANTPDETIRKLLLAKAHSKHSIDSDYHEYDMQYIAKLDLNHIDDKCYGEMKYYLLDPNGIKHVEHVEKLEKLYRGEMLENHDVVLEYLNELEKDSKKIRSKIKILPSIKKALRKEDKK